MNNETKNEVKKNVATGTSTAAGATAGVVIGAALSPEEAQAQETVNQKPEEAQQEPQPARQAQQTNNQETQYNPEPKPETQPEKPTPEPKPTQPESQPEPQPNNSDEVEVVGYDRVTNDDGSKMDVAVLNVNGNEIGVIDVDLDGKADVLVSDTNHNGTIEEGEAVNVQGQGISMQPLQEATGFNPQFANNDLPDYDNNANVDSYMA